MLATLLDLRQPMKELSDELRGLVDAVEPGLRHISESVTVKAIGVGSGVSRAPEAVSLARARLRLRR
jgi:hypothetical protein